MTTFDKYAIKVQNVSKMYKKYRSNLYKILDLFGLCGKNGYDEFWPLKDISLNIKKSASNSGLMQIIYLLAINIKLIT